MIIPPQVVRTIIDLKGDAVLCQPRGRHILHWLEWPSLGIRLLAFMQKVE